MRMPDAAMSEKGHRTLDGNAIMRVRREMHLTTEVFAEALGITRMTLYRWETDGRARAIGPAPYLLQWIIDQSPETRAELCTLIRRALAKEPQRCAILLYARMTRRPARRTG
jgi:DNA-binding transcriptional regulator YiaG